MRPEAYVEMAAVEESHWWFVGRRKILVSLLEQLDLPPRANILEIGAGTGGNLLMLSAFGRVSAIEMDARARAFAIEKTKGQVPVEAGICPYTIPAFPVDFDLVCMFDVLEHIVEDRETLSEVRTRLAPGGRVLVTVPAYQWLWGPHDESLHHKRRYTAGSLRRCAEAAGYHVQKISYFNSLLFPLAVAARLKDRLSAGSAATGTAVPARPLNSLLAMVFGAERHLLRKATLPVGVSLYAVLVTDR